MSEVKVYVTDKKGGMETQGGFMLSIPLSIPNSIKPNLEELVKPLLERTTGILASILCNALGCISANMDSKEIAIPFAQFEHVLGAYSNRLRRRVMKQMMDCVKGVNDITAGGTDE